MSSFAVLSDIHSNYVALEACLGDLRQAREETGLEYPVFILGDVLDTGPMPSETLKYVREISEVHIRGNHEDYLYECLSGLHRERYKSDLWRYVPWTLDQIGHAEFLSYYRSLRFSWESTDRRFWLSHASVSRNDLAPSFFTWTSADCLEEPFFEGDFSRLCIVGHTHLSTIYQRSGGEIWVNAGSVGYPFLGKGVEDRYRPYASYVLGNYDHENLRLTLRIRRVPYELSDILRAYKKSGVLTECEPYSRAIFAQTILNESIVHHAFKEARELKIQTSMYSDFLREYMKRTAYESEIGRILQLDIPL